VRPRPKLEPFAEVIGAAGLMVAGAVLAGPLGFGVGAAIAAKLMGGSKMIGEAQMLEKFRSVISAEHDVYKTGAKIDTASGIPALDDIPIQDRNKWVRIPSVICVYIDMKDSTKLASAAKEKDIASAFQLYTGTAVRLLNAGGAKYIDVRGDGAFGLFDAGEEYLAFVAAVAFKTFANTVAVPSIEERTGIKVGSHIGIDQASVLVRRVGMRETEERYDRQNEVWAGKPVNMAAKLAGLTGDDELIASPRFYANVDHEKARKSCGCGGDGSGKVVALWQEIEVPMNRFDFAKAHKLRSSWCEKHGTEFMEALLALNAKH
jgi:class 3 adenylate cyclase